MRVLAFDIARKTGIALVEDRHSSNPSDPPYQVVRGTTFSVSGGLSLVAQLAALVEGINEAMRGTSPLDAIAYEQVPATWRGAGTIALQYLQYGAFLALMGQQLPYVSTTLVKVSPTEWHRDLLGIVSNRKLLKSHAIQQAKIRTGFETTDPDIADAICVGCWAMGAIRLGMTA